MTHRCGHPTTTGPGTCDRTIPNEADVCFLHDGSGTPPGHGAPEGNTNAVGNSGGGAPLMNSNALVHGGFCDLEMFSERLDDAEQDHIDRLLAAVREKAEGRTPDMDDDDRQQLARRYAPLSVQWGHAGADLADHPNARGVGVEREQTVEIPDGGTATVTATVLNPAWNAQAQIKDRQRQIADQLSLYDSP